jgi:hypothetical protein
MPSRFAPPKISRARTPTPRRHGDEPVDGSGQAPALQGSAPHRGCPTIRFARLGIFDGLQGMGQKYVPTVKDLKAERRFQKTHHTQSKFIKPSGRPAAAPKSGKKK